MVLGDDGALLRTAAADADGLVASPSARATVQPASLAALREVAARMPVTACVRPERRALLRSTYGFERAKGDLRASGVIPTGELAPQHARMELLAGLGAGVDAVSAS